MENRLTIDFTGLCVLVTNDPSRDLKVILACDPMQENGKGTAGKMAREKMGKKKGETMAHEKMVHRPLLSFHVKYFSRFHGKTPMQVIQLPNGDQIASWDLSNRIVRMKKWGPTAYPSDIHVCTGTANLPTCPSDPTTETDMRWIPSLMQVSGSGTVFPEYLSEDPRPASGATALAARFDCPAGHVFANAQVNRQSDSRPWKFKGTGRRDYSQYLADSARLELQSSATDVVTFEAFTFGKGRHQPSETLELLPKEGRLEVCISNLPVILPESEQKTMQHFGIYYALLEGAKQTPIPKVDEAPRSKSVRPSRSSGAVINAHPFGVYPVKCSPGMVP
jgi:hypothetical protein